MRLLLLRHAKAAPLQGLDHERDLTPRGIEQATWAGARIAEQGWTPTLALVSDARRTQQTFERAVAQMPAPPHLTLRPDLYDAEPDAILDAIAAVPPTTACLLVIGHNPGLATLVQRLGQLAPPELRAQLAQGFPPAALAVAQVPGGPSQVETSGTLELLLSPPAN